MKKLNNRSFQEEKTQNFSFYPFFPNIHIFLSF